jgi:hypothetical protein
VTLRESPAPAPARLPGRVTSWRGTAFAAMRAAAALIVLRFTVLRLSLTGFPGPNGHRLRVPSVRLPRPRRGVIGALLGWPAAGATLFVCYLHASRTVAVTSDGASNALQAWDMLHGNPLLRGWQLSDVSFYPTELPLYALVEKLRGLTPDVVHVASAVTYAVLVLLAGSLARGRTGGRAAMARWLIAAGIMLAPLPGYGVYILLGSPDHVGSAVPALLAFLVLDRAPRRWFVPLAIGALLTFGLIADQILVVTAVLPLAGTCVIRAYQARFSRGLRWRDTWFELALLAAAAGSVLAASAAMRSVASHGGFRVWPVSTVLAPAASLPGYLAEAGHGLLVLFGADFFGRPAGLAAAVAAVHLAGLGLAGWATVATVRRFFRADLVQQVLAAAIVATLAAYVLGTRAVDLFSARDIAAVLPCGAALAGRVLAVRLARGGLIPALAAVLAGYLLGLGVLVGQPPQAQPDIPLATWLAAHRLDYGLAGYWNANITTLDSGGRVRLRSVLANGDQVTGDYWEIRPAWYDPHRYDANFIVLVPSPPGFKRYMTIASVRHTFGQPSRIYYVGGFTICVFGRNLLADLVPGSPPAPRYPLAPGP